MIPMYTVCCIVCCLYVVMTTGVDMISACDIRLCCHDTWFQIKEIDLGMAADLGTLQRFPKVIGNDRYGVVMVML